MYESLPFCFEQQATSYLQWRLDWLEMLSVCFNLFSPIDYVLKLNSLLKLIAGAVRLRPNFPVRTLPALSIALKTRSASSNVPAEEPAKKAQSILDALPGNSLISKTAILSSGAGLSIFAISNELYVVNDETVVMVATFSVFWALFKYGGPMYSEWANGQVDKVKGILNAAREDHTTAVKKRIDNVKQLGSVIEVTKQLFELSKVCYT